MSFQPKETIGLPPGRDALRPLFHRAFCLAALTLLSARKDKQKQPSPPQTPPVQATVLPLKPEHVAVTTEFPGRTSASRVAEVGHRSAASSFPVSPRRAPRWRPASPPTRSIRPHIRRRCRASEASLAGAVTTADQKGSRLTITRLDPIYVDLTQPTSTLRRPQRDLATGRLRRVGEDQAEVRLTLEDGTEYPEPGRLQFSEVIVDQSTGSVTLRVILSDANGTLMPGMVVRARLEEGVAPAARSIAAC